MLRNRGLHVFLIPAIIFILYSGFTYSGVQDRSVAFKVGHTLIYLALVLGIGALGGMTVAVLNVMFSKNKGVLGEHTLTVLEEGLEETTAYNRTVNRWSAMPPIWTTSAFHFIFIADNMAHAIPRKRPLLEGDLEAFVSSVQSHIASASAK